jgi:hypothetical protein
MLGRTTEAKAGQKPGNGSGVVDDIPSDTKEIEYFAYATPAPQRRRRFLHYRLLNKFG